MTQDLPFVSVVVTVKDAAATIGGLLESFEALEWPANRLEVVVVDAWSSDATWKMLEAFRSRAAFDVVLKQHSGRIGAGRNEGFRLARGALVAVTDADMRVPPQWLHRLAAAMDDPDIGVVGGPNDSATTDLASRCVACLPVHGPTLGEVPVVGRSRYRSDFTTSTDVYACVTRNSMFSRQAFELAGGFDETLVATEDPELNHRILGQGFRLRFVRDAGVRHVHRDTLGAFYRQQRNYAIGQAHANKVHPEMASIKQAAPAVAAYAFVVLLAFGVFEARFLLWAVVLAGLVAVGVVAYGVRAAVARRDVALLLALPLFVVAWQAAWVFGFPQGQWSKARAS